MTVDRPQILDLVSFSDVPHVVVGVGHDTLSLVPRPDGSVDVESCAAGKVSKPIVVNLAEVTFIASGRDLLLKVAERLVAIDHHAVDCGQWDWSDVDAALAEAASALPLNLFEVVADSGRWSIASVVPDDMLPYVGPAACVIAAHVVGNGDASISDIEDAVARAQSLLDSHSSAPALAL